VPRLGTQSRRGLRRTGPPTPCGRPRPLARRQSSTFALIAPAQAGRVRVASSSPPRLVQPGEPVERARGGAPSRAGAAERAVSLRLRRPRLERQRSLVSDSARSALAVGDSSPVHAACNSSIAARSLSVRALRCRSGQGDAVPSAPPRPGHRDRKRGDQSVVNRRGRSSCGQLGQLSPLVARRGPRRASTPYGPVVSRAPGRRTRPRRCAVGDARAPSADDGSPAW